VEAIDVVEQAVPRLADDRQRPLNVLVTAAGRRTSLVRAFVEAAHSRGAGVVFAGDVDGLAPALSIADVGLRTLKNNDPRYVADLVEIVERNSIGLVVPTVDSDLRVLARGRRLFDRVGCRLAVSSLSFIAVTLDKFATGSTFGQAGVAVPRSWLPPIGRAVHLPSEVFVKPRRGSASLDTYRVSRANLDGVLRIVRRPVVQEVLIGPEITIDALLDLDGRPIHFVPRIRIKTLGGESIQGVTMDHDEGLETWIERVLGICSSLGAVGPLTIQAFLTPRGPVLSEVNPRFGGGFPLAMAAGGAYPAWLLDMVAGQPVEPRLREYEPGLYMTRYNVEIFTRQPRW
jgi:carbamoyl-phosphate synthase large subunit